MRAIVLHSLFEEQITQADSGRIHEMDPLTSSPVRAVVSYFPRPDAYALSPDAYLEHLQRLKGALGIPVIASLNGNAPAAWLKFALPLEQAGADAIELNAYEVVTDAGNSALAVEHGLRQVVQDLKHLLKVPVAVKLSPFYTSLSHVAHELDLAGADGLVLFNRFLQPDIDIRHMTVWPHLGLSRSEELLLRLRWLASCTAG